MEIAALNRDDIDTRAFDASRLLRIRPLSTKTAGTDLAPRLPLKGRTDRGRPLFRPRQPVGPRPARRLGPEGIRALIRHRLQLAGYPADFAGATGCGPVS